MHCEMAVRSVGLGGEWIIVPWTAFHFPPLMQHLPEAVREKAIEIANALLEERMEEGKAIRIAIAKAKE